MNRIVIFLILVLPPMVSSFAFAQEECVGVPDLDYSDVWQEYDGTATLLVLPDGSGPGLTEARAPDGTIVDATIHMALVNNCGGTDPVLGYPNEDMWIESISGGLTVCPGGTIADLPTDQNGETLWSGPMKAGGWDGGNCRVVISGMFVGSSTGLTVNFNSPDIDGNLAVNLSDVVLFTEDYFGGYAFRSDLIRDGSLNLSDLAILAGAVGVACP